MLTGEQVYRVHWVLGTDLLLGVCHCGAEFQADDPVLLWDWLLAHPDGHGHVDSVVRQPVEPSVPRRPVGVGGDR
jgi:hypothetical protein